MKMKMVYLGDEDIEYIKENIPNFSEFVRNSIADHKIIFDKSSDELAVMKRRLEDTIKEDASRKALLEQKIEQLEKQQEKMLNIREHPAVKEGLEFLREGRGNKTAMAQKLSKLTGANITTAHIERWLNETKTDWTSKGVCKKCGYNAKEHAEVSI